MARSIGIEFISALGLPPVEFVHPAADLGCDHIGMALAPIAPNPHHYPDWSLLRDAPLRAAVTAALRERLVPGTGDLPLREIIAALPPGMPLGLAVPQLSLAEAGVDTRTRLSRCVASTRQLLAQVEG
jgi:hypothetical protein